VSQPQSGFAGDEAPFDWLVEKWLEGSLDADLEHELFRRLKDHPEQMQIFVEANVREQVLRDAARGLLLSERIDELAPSRSQPMPGLPMRKLPWRNVWVASSVLACFLIGLVLFVLNERRGPVVEPFVSVTTLDQTDSTLRQGDRLGCRTIEIQSGFLRLQFDDGVEVTLQGPAKYELVKLGKTRLHSGLLTATVPPGAEGFQVSTPTAEVMDLGTAFGIEVDTEGVPLVSVFDGKVEVTPANKGQGRLLQEGESVRVTQSHEIQIAPFDSLKYQKVWPIASGISSSSGAVRFAPRWPRPMGHELGPSDIFVLPEGHLHLLSDPLRVNITSPGTVRLASDLSPGVIPSGTRVRSFLLLFRPLDQRKEGRALPMRPGPEDPKRIVGEITFNRPVLGLIVAGDDLLASETVFSRRGGRFPAKGRVLELFGTPRDDTVTLSEDRRTVKLDLAAFGFTGDQVRVILDQSFSD
jgi:hypothetical protein